MLLARICSALFSALLLLATACASSDLMLPGASASPGINVVDGNGQPGQVGELLSRPLTVEVMDAMGDPLPGATIEFQFTSAGEGGEISPSSTTTDQVGRAEVHLLLGDKVGLQTGEAHLKMDGEIAATATFTAVAAASDPENQAPEADFNWHCDDLSCQFTDASSDSDGDVAGWTWDFGDSGESDQPGPLHVYREPGTYTVTLTVTDDDGATDQSATDVTVSVSPPPPPSNEAPHADFKVHCHDRFCSFTDESGDGDGSIVSWAWDFGDGSSSDQRNPFHFYRDKGHYDVTLTVTDNGGAADSRTQRVDPKD